MDKISSRIKQFQVGNAGEVYILYEDGSMVECEMHHEEKGLVLKVSRIIFPPVV